MTDVKGLKCPNCGANISSDGSVCNYCGSRIVMSDDGVKLAPAGILCPHCSESNRGTERLCSACGTALQCNSHSCDEGIPIDSEHCPSCANGESSLQRWEVVRELDELERANRLLNSKLDTAEGPGGLIAPTILAMFAAGGFCVYGGSGETIGLLISAFLGVPSIGLFWYHFFGRKRQVRGTRNEIGKAQQKLAARKKKALEIG
jgi:hypothetical protein